MLHYFMEARNNLWMVGSKIEINQKENKRSVVVLRVSWPLGSQKLERKAGGILSSLLIITGFSARAPFHFSPETNASASSAEINTSLRCANWEKAISGFTANRVPT